MLSGAHGVIVEGHFKLLMISFNIYDNNYECEINDDDYWMTVVFSGQNGSDSFYVIWSTDRL